MELKRTNSMSEMESFIGTIDPHEFICVVSDAQYFYCYNEMQMIMNHETLIYEGPARNYNQN